MKIATTLVAALLAVATFGHANAAAPARAGKRAPCSDQVAVTYDARQIVARFKIDLPSCWRSRDVYKIKAWIERNEPTAASPQRMLVRRSCDPRRVCRVGVRMGHPSTELVSYRISIEYMATPNGVEVSHRVLTCASAPQTARCEQL